MGEYPLSPNMTSKFCLRVMGNSWRISRCIPTSVCKFSLLFPTHFPWHLKENLSNNQELLEFVIISFILPTLILFDPGVILLEEIRCLSLGGVLKGLTN